MRITSQRTTSSSAPSPAGSWPSHPETNPGVATRESHRFGVGVLDPRAERYLLAVIEAHVATSAPVGSRALTSLPGESLSSASIRTALAGLERLGFVYRPHPSAGRVPTDAGYRYYVDHCSVDRPGPPVPTPGHAPRRVTLRDLSDELHALVIAFRGDEAEADVYGLRHLLGEPEFVRAERLRPLFELLDAPAVLRERLGFASVDGVRVRIGHEHGVDTLSGFSTCIAGVHSMAVAVVGPTRMDYRTVVSRLADLTLRTNRS